MYPYTEHLWTLGQATWAGDRLEVQILGLIVVPWEGYHLQFQHFSIQTMSGWGSESRWGARPCMKQEGGNLGMVLFMLSWIHGLQWPALTLWRCVQVGFTTWQCKSMGCFSLVKGWLNEQFSVKTHCRNHTEEGLLDRKTLQDQVSKYCQGQGKRCCAVFSEEGLGSLGSPNPCGKDRELVRHTDFQANAQLQHWC